jgi:hypothetical protein
LAVVLLAYAGVKSNVMQVQMAVNPADCGMSAAEMAAMGVMAPDPFADASAEKAPPAKAGKSQAAVCGFCADAAHAPLVAYAEPLRPPMAVQIHPSPARPPLGARAPPAIQPKARGPPVLLTA